MPLLNSNYLKLSYMTNEEWALVGNKLKVQQLKAGDYWLTEGKVCQYVGHLETGVLRTFYVNEQGVKSPLLFHLPGNPITDVESFISRQPSKYYIECIRDATVHSLSYEDREFLMNTIPNYERIVLKITEALFIQMSERMVNLALLSAEERYLRLIKSEPHIFDYLTLGCIAEYINIKPQSLSRIRKKLADEIS